MKKFYALSTGLCAFALSLLVAGCSKEGDPVPEPNQVQETTLEFTVVNEEGEVVEGAVVDLYISEEAWMREDPADIVTSGKTDANGKVRLTEVEARQYYFSINQGASTVLSNWEGIIATEQPLEEDKLTAVEVVVKESIWAYLAATRKSWAFDKIYLDSEDITSQMEECSLDDILTFTKNYIYKASEGEMMCEHSTAQESSAAYEIEGLAITLIDEEEGERNVLHVLNISRDRLEFRSEGLREGVRIVLKAVYN